MKKDSHQKKFAERREFRLAIIRRRKRNPENAPAPQLHSGITKAANRLDGLLKAWRHGSLLGAESRNRPRPPILRGAASARRRLHREAERWAKSDGQLPLNEYSREQALWDSYWTMELMMQEVRQYRSMIVELSEPDLLEERDKLLSAGVGRQTVRELNYLLALIELRRNIDVQRSALLRRGELRAYVPFELDAALRDAFERILQSIPLFVGVTPDRGTHDYARSAHFARDLVAKRYAAIQSVPRHLRAQYIPASSAMALLYDVISAATMEVLGRRENVRIGLLAHAYFETRDLLKRGLPFLKAQLNLIQIDDDKPPSTNALDILLLETIGNHPDAVVITPNRVRGLLQNHRALKFLIVDVTLNPLVMPELAACIPDCAVFVAIDSLTKYAQAGTNVAIGGMVTIIAGRSSEARDRAKQLCERLQEMIRTMGQHMDPRLAIVLVPTREILEKRIERMRRNASLIAGAFRGILPSDRVGHACEAGIASTLVYMKGRINWSAANVPEFRRFRGWLPGQDRTKVVLREVERHFIRSMDEGSSSPAIIRVSTSFGFSPTSVHCIAPKNRGDDFWVRVSAGVENVEHLEYVIQFRLGELLPFLTRDWEPHYAGRWPSLIRDEE